MTLKNGYKLIILFINCGGSSSYNRLENRYQYVLIQIETIAVDELLAFKLCKYSS